jgi:tetratricopeptide (TPR) repeat protein
MTGYKTGGVLTPPVLFVLLLGVLGNGGDWPFATFLIRSVLFVSFAIFLHRFLPGRIRVNIVDILVVFLWSLGAASLARNGYPWITYQWFLHHSAALCLYIMIRALPGLEGRLPKTCAILLLATACFQVLFAMFQMTFQGEIRPFGTLANPNFLAEFLAYAAAVSWILASQQEGASRRPWMYGLVLLFLIGIGLTRSRGGFLLVIALGSFLAAERIGWRRSLAVAAVLVAAVFLVPNPLRDRFLGKGDPFAFERISMWKASFRIFREHPLGVGVGHFKYYWHLVRDPVEGTIIRYAKYARTPHSEFFSVMSELGLPGVIAFLGLGAAGVVSLRRAVSRKDPVVLGGVLILFASFLHSFFEYNYHVLGMLLVNAAALGIVSGRLFRPVREWEFRLGNAGKGLAYLLLGVCIIYSGATFAGTVLEGKGSKSFLAGRMEEAGRWFRRASLADPWRGTYADSGSAVCYRLYEEGKGERNLYRAIALEQEAYLRNPMDFRYPARLGYLFSKATDHVPAPARKRVLDAAFSSYDAAIARNPHAADLRYLKALLLRMTGREAEARRLIESVLRDEPAYVKGWVLLGNLKEKEDREGALVAYEKALAVNSRYRDRAVETYEKEYVELDQTMVKEWIQSLRSGRGR